MCKRMYQYMCDYYSICEDSLKDAGDAQINSRFRSEAEARRIWCFHRVSAAGADVLRTLTFRLQPGCCSFNFYAYYLHLSPSSIPHHEFLRPIWERCRLGSLFECPSTVSSPSHHLLIALQSAAGLPTGQFRWSAVSLATAAHPPTHPPSLPLKDEGTVPVTSVPPSTTTLAVPERRLETTTGSTCGGNISIP